MLLETTLVDTFLFDVIEEIDDAISNESDQEEEKGGENYTIYNNLF
jgi:hypothetical protein